VLTIFSFITKIETDFLLNWGCIPVYSSKILTQIYSHSIEEYPFECCGCVFETPPENRQIILPCKNIQNELHKSSPEENPRDARTAYTISPIDILKINQMERDQNYHLKAIYHSHPDHKAYFSKQDYAMATFDHEPTYPGTDYIVVSIINKKVKEAICFSWDNKSKGFLVGETLQTY